MTDAADRAAVDIDRIINTPRRVRLDQEGLDVLAATIRVHQDAKGVAKKIRALLACSRVAVDLDPSTEEAIANLIRKGRGRTAKGSLNEMKTEDKMTWGHGA